MNDENQIDSRGVKNPDRVPPGQQVTDEMPVLHYGKIQKIDPTKWKFTITGLVEKKIELSLEEFKSLPQSKVVSDIHCVTGWSKLDNTWEGVLAVEIGKLARILPGARYVMIHAAGGFTANLSTDDFFQPDVIFALRHNGRELTPEHGYPVRLVVPRLYFWKSAKWVEGVEFMKEERLGFWETHGYHRRGDPWAEERYSYQ
ncbi:MAG: sulfite oxidase-like oxidoreductase [Thermoplasmata archaeon]